MKLKKVWKREGQVWQEASLGCRGNEGFLSGEEITFHLECVCVCRRVCVHVCV